MYHYRSNQSSGTTEQGDTGSGEFQKRLELAMKHRGEFWMSKSGTGQAVDPSLIEQAHHAVRSSGAIPAGMLPSVIELSWQRCLDFGLDSEHGSEYDPMRQDLLSEQIEKNRKLLSHAQPVMDMLYEQIVDTENVVVLANESGYILHSRGDAEFLKRAERVALTPGVEWSESMRGTNAIGTAIAVGEPVVIHGNQHFLAANHMLTCSASPIFGPNGELSGILDVSGDHRSYNPHTLALVRMSVQMIENRMFGAAFADTLTIRFHARPEFIGTLCEGMAAFSEDGTLLSVNRNACYQLGMNLGQLQGRNFASLFGMPVARVLDHLLVRPNDALMLTLGNGMRVQAHASLPGTRLRRHTRLGDEAAQKPPAAPAPTNPAAAPCPLGQLLTGDPQVEAVVAKVRKVIGRDIPVLIQGETGTGKELLANAIHRASPRAAKPFVAVNCAAIPEGLIESELFGYEEGAFTGARRKGQSGRIQQADGGTLFLDEIGDMPLALQARLLRVLQERVVIPLGSHKGYPVNISVICATHRRLRELVTANLFREDLYFRLNGLTVTLPPLRARADLEGLLGAMLRDMCGPHAPAIAPDVLELFRSHPWPGNIRQLSNLMRTATVMAEGEPSIGRQHLPDDFFEDLEAAELPVPPLRAAATATAAVSRAPTPEPAAEPVAGKLQDVALQAMRDAVRRHDGNISAAARELGVSRNTLYRKLKP
jgi:transcriptional regulator of acetoin/glycerol metabolism